MAMKMWSGFMSQTPRHLFRVCGSYRTCV